METDAAAVDEVRAGFRSHLLNIYEALTESKRQTNKVTLTAFRNIARIPAHSEPIEGL
jgi:hypothetical protein